MPGQWETYDMDGAVININNHTAGPDGVSTVTTSVNFLEMVESLLEI